MKKVALNHSTDLGPSMLCASFLLTDHRAPRNAMGRPREGKWERHSQDYTVTECESVLEDFQVEASSLITLFSVVIK